MAIINPTINLVARPGMTLPSPWVFTRDGSELDPALLNKVTGASESEKRAKAATGTFITATTTLGSAAANLLRHDYSASNDSAEAGTYNGFLLEAGSENLLLTHTPSISTRNLTTWSKVGTVMPASALGKGIKDVASITGDNTATLLPADALVYKEVSSLTSGSTYTLSAFFKSVSGAASVGLKGLSAAPSNTDAVSSSRTVSSPYNWVMFTSKFTAAANNFVAISAARDCYVDRVQLEKDNCTSSILLDSKIRAAESLYYPGTPSGASLLDPYEGTVYVMFKPNENVENIAGINVGVCQLGASVGTGTLLRLVVRLQSDTAASANWKLFGSLISGSTEQSAIQTIPNADWPSDNWFKVAVRYRAGETNSLRMSVNGKDVVYSPLADPILSTLHGTGLSVTTSSGTSGESTAPILLGKVKSVQVAAGTPSPYYTLDGSLMHFAYFPKALSDTDLKAITS